jgi:hypothetical protein
MMPAMPLLQELLLQLLNVWRIGSSTTGHTSPVFEHLSDWNSCFGRLQLPDGSACGQFAAAGARHGGCDCSSAREADFR